MPQDPGERIMMAARASLDRNRRGGRRGGRGPRVWSKGFALRGPWAVLGLLLMLMLLGPLLLLVGVVLGAAAFAAMVAGVIWWLRGGKRRMRAPQQPPIRQPEEMRAAPLPELAGATSLWIGQTAAALPAPAAMQAMGIGQRLEALAPALAGMAEEAPEAREWRRLMSDHLPELVSAWEAIPPHARAEAQQAQLTQGLARIGEEIDQMASAAADPALDRLAVHARFLDYRYGEKDD
ncbi:MAG TPA: hypothetical protein VN222_17785 [Novosphingobium sp.]|nr:hypothetical protein [Novosphingobium sp.]